MSLKQKIFTNSKEDSRLVTVLP